MCAPRASRSRTSRPRSRRPRCFISPAGRSSPILASVLLGIAVGAAQHPARRTCRNACANTRCAADDARPRSPGRLQRPARGRPQGPHATRSSSSRCGDIRGALREADRLQGSTASPTASRSRSPSRGCRQGRRRCCSKLTPADRYRPVRHRRRRPIVFDLDRSRTSSSPSPSRRRASTPRSRRAIDQSLQDHREPHQRARASTEPSIQQQGKDRIVIQLPGIGDPDQVVKTDRPDRQADLPAGLRDPAHRRQPDTPPPECAALPLKEDPKQMLWVQTSSARHRRRRRSHRCAAGLRSRTTSRSSASGSTRRARCASASSPPTMSASPSPSFSTSRSSSYPRINEPILGGSGQISGNFTVEEANNLAIVLRSGALPAKLDRRSSSAPSVRASAPIRSAPASSPRSSAWSRVMIFMLIAYGLFGIFANIALHRQPRHADRASCRSSASR